MLPYSLAQLPNQPPLLAMDRLRFAASGLAAQMGHPYFPTYPGLDHPLSPYRGFDPRTRFIQEEPKPQHSYIGLIAMAILSSPDKKLVLSDIYQWILDNYPYFRTRGPGWRNSIRHNLSLNDCFIKSGRSANGKGHYWAIHPANVEDFKKCDFRRRRAQRKARKAMGYQVPDEDDDEDSPCGSPAGVPIPMTTDRIPAEQNHFQTLHLNPGVVIPGAPHGPLSPQGLQLSKNMTSSKVQIPAAPVSRKRQFDMESLLAPEPKREAGEVSPKSEPPTGAQGIQFPPFGMVQNPFLPWNLPGLMPAHNEPSEGQTEPKEPVAQPPSPTSAQKWQETFAKIMARSYQARQGLRFDIAAIKNEVLANSSPVPPSEAEASQ